MRSARTHLHVLAIPLVAAAALAVPSSASPHKLKPDTAKRPHAAVASKARQHSSTSKAMLPKHKPFRRMSLKELASYQRLTLQRDAYTIGWWKASRARVLADAQPRFPLCLGGRMPVAVCWHYKHRAWTKPLYRRTLRLLHPQRPQPTVDACLAELIQRESGGNPLKWNGGYVGRWDPYSTHGGSGAYGLPQALPGSKMASAGPDWATNPATQIRWMLGYVQHYGGSCAALAFQKAHGWY